MLELARSAIHQAGDLVWGWWTIALLLGTGVVATMLRDDRAESGG